ncbi:MAG: hypothetical protein QGF68_06065, partial [Nitrospinota bacterium]|nr:hypothetical protein [Nitrospinota bacterium]
LCFSLLLYLVRVRSSKLMGRETVFARRHDHLRVFFGKASRDSIHHCHSERGACPNEESRPAPMILARLNLRNLCNLWIASSFGFFSYHIGCEETEIKWN